MSILAERNVQAPDVKQTRAALPMRERRKDERHKATYRPCCLIHDGRANMGLLRNFSAKGACIESRMDLSVGDEITYFWESKLNIRARIVWHEGGRYGLEHIEQVAANDSAFPARSVRVPCEVEAHVWINGNRHTAIVENISMGGVRLRGRLNAPFGTLMTICFCGLEIEAASARWSRDGAVGARFKERLSRSQLAELLLDEQITFAEIEFGS